MILEALLVHSIVEYGFKSSEGTKRTFEQHISSKNIYAMQ